MKEKHIKKAAIHFRTAKAGLRERQTTHCSQLHVAVESTKEETKEPQGVHWKKQVPHLWTGGKRTK